MLLSSVFRLSGRKFSIAKINSLTAIIEFGKKILIHSKIFESGSASQDNLQKHTFMPNFRFFELKGRLAYSLKLASLVSGTMRSKK